MMHHINMSRNRHTFFNLASVIVAVCCPVAVQGEDVPDQTLQPICEKIVQRSRQEIASARIRAALADRRDIRSRYIRVRCDGETVDLAGFVTDTAQAATAEEIARRVASDAVVHGFWAFEPDLDERDAYMTRIGEQAADAKIWARVQVALRGPDVRPLLADADVQAVVIRHGKVRVYLILDKAGIEIDLVPHLRSITGVTDVSIRTVTATMPEQPAASADEIAPEK